MKKLLPLLTVLMMTACGPMEISGDPFGFQARAHAYEKAAQYEAETAQHEATQETFRRGMIAIVVPVVILLVAVAVVGGMFVYWWARIRIRHMELTADMRHPHPNRMLPAPQQPTAALPPPSVIVLNNDPRIERRGDYLYAIVDGKPMKKYLPLAKDN